MKRPTSILLTLASAVLVTLAAAPAAAQLTPSQIVQRSLDQQVFRNKGAEMKIEMRLVSKGSEPRRRLLAASTLRRGGLSHTMARVLAPQDLAGTAFLFKQKDKGADEQFMYLAALRVTKRIVGEQKSARFLGSQFTYGDLEWGAVEDASYTRLPDKAVGADPCHVIEATPRGDNNYSKLTLWIRASDYTLVRMKFFDKERRLKKVLFVKRVERIGGRLVATRLKMKNVRTGDATLLSVSEIKLRDDFSAERFSVRELKKH